MAGNDEYIMNDDAFKQVKSREELTLTSALNLLRAFDPEIERFTREINKPNPGDLFYFYDKDDKYEEDYKVDGYQWLGQGENKKYPPSNPVCLKTYYDAKSYNQTTKKKRNDARVPEASHQTFER